jgi:serine/threonine protein kinase
VKLLYNEGMSPPDEFLKAVALAQVLDAETARRLIDFANVTGADAPRIAQHALEQRWLTPYQLKRIQSGKGHKLRVGPYLLFDILGEGSMGRVFRARHSRTGRDVALKVIRSSILNNPRAVERFQREVRAVGQLVHPNIVLAIDADTAGQQHYVAMELIDGSDLKNLVLKHGPMPAYIACEYVRQAALGLQHAHEQRLVHRDVKPSNLMVTKQGTVKLLDLGLAMLNDPAEHASEQRMTLEGIVVGTPDYLAPEQARNSAHVDGRADIYALGGTLFYLLTGRIPYEGPTATAKVIRHANDPVPSVRSLRPEIPASLDGIVQWMMAKLPENRPACALDVAAALQPFSQPPMELAPPPPPEPAAASTGQMFSISDAEVTSHRRRRRTPQNSSVMLVLFTVLAIVAAALIIAVVQLSGRKS